jgi:hypothetical protein
MGIGLASCKAPYPKESKAEVAVSFCFFGFFFKIRSHSVAQIGWNSRSSCLSFPGAGIAGLLFQTQLACPLCPDLGSNASAVPPYSGASPAVLCVKTQR